MTDHRAPEVLVGVGPRTVLDITCHIGVVILLVFGLVVVARRRDDLAER